MIGSQLRKEHKLFLWAIFVGGQAKMGQPTSPPALALSATLPKRLPACAYKIPDDFNLLLARDGMRLEKFVKLDM